MLELEQVLSGERRFVVLHGDCIEKLRLLPDNSVDSTVTDPPSGIEFMGADWDSDKGGMDEWVDWLEDVMVELMRVLKPGAYGFVWALPRTSHWTGMALERAGFHVIDSMHHVFGTGYPKFVNASKAIDNHDFRIWLHQNPGELELHRKTRVRCRALKNGKASHWRHGRDSCAQYASRLRRRIDRMQRRRAGLLREVTRSYTASGNTVTPIDETGGTYVTGTNNSEAVELHETRGATERSRQWDGFATGLKPGHEVWWLIQKPLNGTIATNLLEHGTGAMNIDACRVSTDWSERPVSWRRSCNSANTDAYKIAAPPGEGINCHPIGRWPANWVMSHNEDCRKDWCTDGCPVRIIGEQGGTSVIPIDTRRFTKTSGGAFSEAYANQKASSPSDKGSVARYFQQLHPKTEDPCEQKEQNQDASTNITSPGKGICEGYITADVDCSTTLSGKSTTGQSPKDTRSTIGTETKKTTVSKTSKCSMQRLTSESIADANSAMESGGNHAPSASDSSQSILITGTFQKKGGLSTVDASLAILEKSAREKPPFVYMPKPNTSEREAGLEKFETRTGAELTNSGEGTERLSNPRTGTGRGGGRRNVHSTVKGWSFMAYLMRLVTPPGGLSVDPFCGSGSGGIAAMREGFRWIGIELNDTEKEPYVRIARARIEHVIGRPPEEAKPRFAEHSKQGVLF